MIASDHIDPEELADRLMGTDDNLLVVDIRPARDFTAFHLPGAINVMIPDLLNRLQPYKLSGKHIVICSNGTTHAAQARDALTLMGYQHTYVLTDGMAGFVEQCLKPASLRSDIITPMGALKIKAWRAYFLGGMNSPVAVATTVEEKPQTTEPALNLPGLIPLDWLTAHAQDADLIILDVRSQNAYNTGHIAASRRIDPESFRGMFSGIPSMLDPSFMIAGHLGAMGVSPGDTIVIIWDGSFRDATLVSMALERVGHTSYGILADPYAAWVEHGLPVTTALPTLSEGEYPVNHQADTFTVTAAAILQAMGKKRTPSSLMCVQRIILLVIKQTKRDPVISPVR